jgi:5-formyltetrahydrofolate cyclo-ligase
MLLCICLMSRFPGLVRLWKPLCLSLVGTRTTIAARISHLSAMSQGQMDDIKLRKQSLRTDMRSQLKALSNDEIQRQSQAAFERLKLLSAYRNASSIGVFLSMPSGEFDTTALIEDAVREGKTLYVPQVGGNFEKPDMDLLKIPLSKLPDGRLFYREWLLNKWGIPEPPPGLALRPAVPGDIDLLIVPGLAFDRSGKRLGQGKGYYDRFIARMTLSSDRGNSLLRVAVGLDCQLVTSSSTIPTDEHDALMDYVIVPSETVVVDNHVA